MKKNNISLIAALLAVACSSAQTTFTGKITNLPNTAQRSISIEYWYEDAWQFLDSVNLNKAGFFRKTIKTPAGQIRLRLWGSPNAWLDCIAPPYPTADSVLDFGQLNASLLSCGTAYLDGAEHEAYFALTSAWRKQSIRRDSVAFARRNIVENDPQGVAKNAALQAIMQRSTDQYERFLRDIATQQAGTFTGDIVAKTLLHTMPREAKTPAPGDSTKTGGLGLLSLGDERILRYQGLIAALQQQWSDHYNNDPQGLQQFTDDLMAKRSGKPTIDLFLFRFLLEMCLERADEAALGHLLAGYTPDCSAADSPSAAQAKDLLAALDRCKIGQPAFEVELLDPENKTVSLSSLSTQNNCTLLVFWRSDCPHCHELMPVLQQLLERYRSKGLGIVAVSLDETAADWLLALEKEGRPWPNLWALAEERKAIYQHFPIIGTPALIALDAEGNVLARMLDRRRLEEFLKSRM